MLYPRAATILNSIARQYISRALPVSSASVVDDCGLAVSSATIRNEMTLLEEEDYIFRPHHAAGSIPSDKGYRYYVGTLENVKLPLAEQRLISHLFHQVEKELEEWLNLAVTLIAQRVQNIAIVTVPRPAACQLKHFELVLLHDNLALAVLVLRGARIRQQLIAFEKATSQADLALITNKLNAAYSGLTGSHIRAKKMALSPAERQVTDCLLELMKTEDGQEHEELYIDGLHFMFNQPEFSRGQRMLTLMELVEQRRLVGVAVPEGLEGPGVRVIIGQENKAEVIHDLSVVISRYGLPDEAVGTIGVIGPTRMPYAHAISTVGYLSSLMSRLVAELYGEGTPVESSPPEVN